MNLLLAPNSLLFWLCLAIALPVLLLSLVCTPWRQLAATGERQHLLGIAIVGLATLWLLRVKVQGVFAFHPFLMTVTTMVFGLGLALVVGFMALVLLKLFQMALGGVALDSYSGIGANSLWWKLLPVDFCISILLPAVCAWALLWFINRWRFKNPFTYIWGVGFFGAMLSCLVVGCVAWLLFWLSNSHAHQLVLEQHFFVFLLMMFPEGFINGILATSLTVLTPHLVRTYRDDWFLR